MSYKISTTPANHQFTVEKDETILSAGLKENLGLPYGCRNGLCGSCMATIISGEVSYPEGTPKLLIDKAGDACLLCKAIACSDLELNVRENKTEEIIESKVMPCRVVDIEHLAHDVIRMHLKLPDNQELKFKAGQYLEFILADKSRRAFSIANTPNDEKLIELHIRHVDGGKFTDWAFSQMEEKAILRIEFPLGTFSLNEESDRPLIFIGGGTGFAPLKGQIEELLSSNDNRPVHLYWGVRSECDLYLPALPESWAKDFDNVHFTAVLSEPNDDWQGRTGWVHNAVIEDINNLANFDIYMAGPPPMIIAARDALSEKKFPSEQLYYDSFEYAADKKKIIQ